MSFIISVYVDEGIVLASDRRATYNITKNEKGVQHTLCGIHTSNSTDKSFICPNGTAILTCGDASVNKKPIAGYIKSFIREKVTTESNINDIPQMIIDYFNTLSKVPNTAFIIAGYSNEGDHKAQRVFRVYVKSKQIFEIDTKEPGAIWDGEIDTLVRLVKEVGIKESDSYTALPSHDILWTYFTLQDAVDFARYAVETTIKTMHFYNVVETVGGCVDIIVITPNETKWLQKEELH